MPIFNATLCTGCHEEAWLNHLHKVQSINNGELQEIPVTSSGFSPMANQKMSGQGPQLEYSLFSMRSPHQFPCRNTQCLLSRRLCTEFVNPGQVPVIEGDCPLYAQQKKCQWEYPEEVVETKMVCFICFLHVEMTFQECGGKLLVGSGRDQMFS